ncbi:MAG: hypothetical protein JJE35_01815 [Thermoleophilia bacterium]|nr:hypothetical protein [Thermoleophilia bacterium]
MSGKVNPKGTAVAQCRFEYGTSTAYGASTPCTPNSLGTGAIAVPVSAEVGALEQGTVYHYRVVASSVNGASEGVDRVFTTSGEPNCPNAGHRFEQGITAIQLPACMALEHVSPAQKFSQRAAAPTISVDGERIAFKSLAPLANTPGNVNAFYGDVYLASRGQNGWTSASTSPPAPYNFGWGGNGKFMARSFDPGLSRWIVVASTELGSRFASGIAQAFRGAPGGSFSPISPLLVPTDIAAMWSISETETRGKINVRDSVAQGVSTDHSRVFLAMGEPVAAYLPDDPIVSGPGSDRNVYLVQLDSGGQPSIELAARDEVGPDAGKAWGANCGIRIGGIGRTGVGWRNQGAVSADGSHVYYSARASQPASGLCTETSKLRILERTEVAGLADTSQLIPNDGLGECVRVAPACKSETEVNGDDFYQGASVDQSKVYFTTNRQLADSDLDGSATQCSGSVAVSGCDLYLYDADQPVGERLTQVSAGQATTVHPVVGEGANVLNGTVAISGDGSHVYFAATSVLTDGANPKGRTASEYPAADPKLYAWSSVSEAIEFIGALAATDANLWGANGTFLNGAYPVPATGTDGLGNEVGGDGHVLLFQSTAALTENDTDGGRLDSFRYESAASSPTLQCVSCRPGAADSEPFAVSEALAEQVDVPGTGFAEEGRWVSEDGESVIIRTTESLVPSDTNGLRNDYLWREGGLTLLPGTTPSGSNTFGERPPVLSHDGTEVAFTAYTPLLPTDGDTAPDIYVARVNGGFANPVAPDPCVEEVCRPAPTAGPGEPNVTSIQNDSRGNVKPDVSRRCPKGKRKVVRSGKVRCVKRTPSKKGAAKNRTNYDRGGQK